MIGKVNGVLAEYIGHDNEHGRIQVLSYKDNGETIVDKQEIKKSFPPYGFVFAPRVVENFGHTINSLLEFSISPIPSPGLDTIVMDVRKDCRKIGIEVYEISEDILENEFSIDQPRLKLHIKTESSNFYIKNQGFLFGPFRCSNGDILPKLGVGKEVNKCKPTDTEILLNGKTYLLSEPINSLGKVDCMTPQQLSEWMKRQIQNLEIRTDINALQNALQAQELKELDKARMLRIMKNIDHVSFNLTQLKLLSTTSDRFQNLFKEQIELLREELREELVQPLENKRGELEQEVAVLEKTVRKAEKNRLDLDLEVNKLTDEYKLISSQKERLIEDIKIHSLVGKVKMDEQKSLHTFEEQIFLGSGDSYQNLSEFLSTVNSSIVNIEAIDKRYIFNCFNQLSQSRIILTDNFGSILQVAKLSNNCRLFIQQVEATWIKFEYFYENGLKQSWESAYLNPGQIHFLLLEDINLASIECYGRPLLDILAGIRRKIPGIFLEWPKNLWILASPVIEAGENHFGLPLFKKTFKRCAAFQRIESEVQFKTISPVKVLQVDHLLNNDILAPNYLNDYFNN